MASKTHNKLVEQQDALGAFFESLMHDVEAFAEAEDATAASESGIQPASVPDSPGKPASRPTLVSAPKPVAVESPATTIFETLPSVAPAVTEAAPKLETPPPVEASEPAAPVPEPEPAAAPVPPAPADPAWLGQELQAMLFKVAGLTLAVPLVDLNGVVEWDEARITEMPGHADFYLGLMTHLKRQIPVVDTARLVLPENKRVQLAGEDPRQRVTRVVLINDSRYGLACDEVNEVVTLKADAVRWRSERTQRRWLAGTVIEHMCALVDATAFAELLAERAPVNAFRE
jgi:purine-binding chemotaxis protein CheW